MKYEKVKFKVGDEVFDVVHCLGDGQCECSRCKENGRWSLSWTPWFYKMDENDEDVLCPDCLRELLIQERVNRNIRNTAKEIYNMISAHPTTYLEMMAKLRKHYLLGE